MIRICAGSYVDVTMVEVKGDVPACGNAILDIVREDYPFLFNSPHSKVKIRKNETILIDKEISAAIYFPIDMIFSLRCDLSSGYTAEFSQVGPDGMLGISCLTGDGIGESSAIALTSGYCYKFDAVLARKIFENSSAFRRAILGYMEGQMRESAQRIVCSKFHSITEQMCRTLLMAADRLGSETLSLTHEQIAIAIGCRREAVSISAGKLQNAGIIQCEYGKITILDRAALEKCSCECYSVIRQGFRTFIPERPHG